MFLISPGTYYSQAKVQREIAADDHFSKQIITINSSEQELLKHQRPDVNKGLPNIYTEKMIFNPFKQVQ